MLIDSHAHLTSSAIFDRIDLILERAESAGVKKIVNICTDPLTLTRGIELSRRYPWIFQAAATTPHDVEKEGEAVFEIIKASALNRELIAIGETGLDYFYEHSNRAVQKEFLRRYLQLAIECKLPVIIHCRDAFLDFFEIIDSEYPIRERGLLHCFTGTMKEAENLIERGWMISISGIVTFKKSHELQEVAKTIPLNSLLIETDAPFLAPQQYRGKQNEPAYLIETAKFIASLRGISFEELANATAANTERFFKFQ